MGIKTRGNAMTDTGIQAPKGALLDGPGAAKKAEAPLIAQVAQQFGVSPLRQMRDIFSMRRGAQKLSGPEYYSLRLFDPDIAPTAKRAFLGQAGINALNTSMNPPVAVPTRAFVGNKLLYTQLLAQLGIGTSTTQALVSKFRDAGKLPILRSADDIATFLRETAQFPLFGKPHHGSLSEGSVRIDGRDGDTLRLGNGLTQDIAAFAEEVMDRYPGGFLMQTALDPHPDMAVIAGPSIGCVRIVTVNDGAGPTPAYAVWKLPAPAAMSDNFWQDGSLLAHIDLHSGEILTCVRGTGLKAERMADHPVSGAPMVGVTLPFWAETLKIAQDAHAVFPEFGVCGFDIAVTADGPKVLECNDNPSHMLYQIASGTGVTQPELAPTWDAVAQRQSKQVARLNAGTRKKR
ncbi:sugar-transfer associated ATP-grasp domain-containing protein [uncultured Tateyamaria sp.]|uniref:sugar-transfer associated ATP-grasp domain-containing protein n=2 Tax=uncultured Tateyamaria sp. TaxID=455651 RepID=UPI0026216414|nr:sugar-transfer associated ATP-grasp domain-containing protein [uncultured Tateyamaria sp.]